MYAAIILTFMAVLMNGCKEPEKNHKRTEYKNKQFKYCMEHGKTSGQSLKNLRKECKRYAEVSEVKDKAVKKCTKWKTEEIGWTNKEIDLYCNKFWRGYNE